MIFAVLAVLFSLPALASDIKMPQSALSTDSPNKDRIVLVAKVNNVINGVGTDIQQMTIEKLISNRPTIQSMIDGSPKLCEIESKSNPVCKHGGIIVLAENNPATLTIATFKHASGEPMNVREVSWNEFHDAKSAVIGNNGPIHLDCHFKNGRKTSICRMASNN